jgi:hypothetical protein
MHGRMSKVGLDMCSLSSCNDLFSDHQEGSDKYDLGSLVTFTLCCLTAQMLSQTQFGSWLESVHGSATSSNISQNSVASFLAPL